MKLVNARGMDRLLQDYKNKFEGFLLGPVYALAFAKILNDPPAHLKVLKKDNLIVIYNKKKNNESGSFGYDDFFVVSVDEKKSTYKLISIYDDAKKIINNFENNPKELEEKIKDFPYNPASMASKDTKELYQNISNKFLNNKNTQSILISKDSFSEGGLEPILDMSSLNSFFTIRKLVELAYPKLEDLVVMDKVINETFVPALNKEAGLQEHNEVFKEELAKLFKYAKETNSKNKFEFNDLDNCFYLKKDILVLKNQNYSLELTEKDGIYTIVSVNNPKETEDLLKNNRFTFDSHKEHFTINSLDEPFVLAYFLLELNCAVEAYEKENGIEQKSNEIVKSYEYYLAYHSKKYNLTKEDCVWHILFYGFPGGGQPDGNFNYDSREYLPYEKSVEKLMSTIHETIKRKTFTCATVYDGNVELCKKITNLNQSWLRLFVDAKEMVTDFLEKYEKASQAKKDKMLVFKECQTKNYQDLKEFLIIADNLIKKHTITNKPLKV